MSNMVSESWYVVLVTGSRSMADGAREVTERMRTHVEVAHGHRQLAVLVHGYCPHPMRQYGEQRKFSTDALAEQIANWDQVISMPMRGHEGKPRNERMVRLCKALQAAGHDVVVEAFPPKGRARSGTRNCMRLAREAGLKMNVTEVT
jgi:hypothetical protein